MDANIFPSEKIEAPVNPGEKKLFAIEAGKKEIIRFLLIFWLTSSVFLILRLFMKAIGADTKSVFAAFTYLISGFFLLPFFGIFSNVKDSIEPGKSTFDSLAVTAIFCYSILILFIIGITHIGSKMLKTGKQVDEAIKKDNPIDPTLSEKVIK